MIANRIAHLAGFVLAAGFAVADGWTLQAFSWSTWLAGLVLSVVGVISAAIHTVFTTDSLKGKLAVHIPWLNTISSSLFRLLVLLILITLVPAVLYLYAFIYSIYGMLLSFFAEMEPVELFGRNGFINSDFITPVGYLLKTYWAMALGTIMAEWELFTKPEPWKRIVVPAETGMMRVHIYVVVMPFVALFAYSLFGDSYHSLAIVILMALFYFLPVISGSDAKNSSINSG
jgi:hypothetical protein